LKSKNNNMKNVYFLLILSLFTSSLIAQRVDEVSIGAGYSQQTYYSLATGEMTTLDGDAWDIAFSATGLQDAGVLINEGAPLTGAPLEVYAAGQIDFEDVSTDVATYVEEDRLYNPDENWEQGAFNTEAEEGNPFDYGWGAYDPMSRTVIGTHVYVIKKRDGSYIKLEIQSLELNTYNFRYADLDGTNEISHSISKEDANSTPWIYFSFETNKAVDVPENWDLLFTRYSEPLDNGEGGILNYNLTGVLMAPGLEAATADGVDPETVLEADYQDQYSKSIKSIGYDWKFFDFSVGWIIDEDRAYFIKSNSEAYKLIFFDFEGSSTGTTTLEVTPLQITSTESVSDLSASASIFPNPTEDFIHFDFSTQSPEAYLKVIDFSGRLIHEESVLLNEPYPIKQYVGTGSFTLQATTADGRFTHRIMIQ